MEDMKPTVIINVVKQDVEILVYSPQIKIFGEIQPFIHVKIQMETVMDLNAQKKEIIIPIGETVPGLILLF